jgi:beta-lactamase class A
VEVSDNVAALALLELVGADNVNLTLQGRGLEATRLRVGGASRDWGGPAGQNTTSAREMGLLLETIATGDLLSERASEEAIALLSRKQQAAWLPNLLPGRVVVAHKSGELEGIRHDAGIVYTPRNQFVVVVLNDDLANYRAAGDTISRVARAAYDYLETGKR